MKKEVLNLVFYLVCFIVLLLFAAMFFNWKSLEGFREGADEVAAATTDSSAAATTTTAVDTTATTSGNTVVTSTDSSVPVSTTTTTGTTYVASDSTSSAATTGTTYTATTTPAATPAATTGTTYTTTDTATPSSAASSTVVATPASTITTNPSCNTIIGDDKLGVYLKPKYNHVYPIIYTTSPDTCTLAHFILENGKQIQSIDNGKNTMVYFSPTTAVVGGMAYGKFCTETNNARTKLPITYTSNTLQVKYDKTDYYVVFVNDSGKYVAAMRRIGDSNLSPNMIRSICQTLK